MAYKNPSRNLTRPHNGFTLIELLVVIGIAAIVVSIAVPSFAQMVSQQRVKAAANDFKSAIALARSEARKTGLNTNIRQIGKTAKTSGSWEKMSDGWHVYNKESGTVTIKLAHKIEAGSINLKGNAKKGLVLAGKTGRINEEKLKEICFEDANNNSDISAYTVYVNKAGSAVITESETC
ncbi:MAG: GspH/FimT family pseudopilin [Porticoccaceae bacterium]